jgi:hypothetical protein
MQTQLDEAKWQAFSERVTYQGQPHVGIEAFDPTPEDIARCNERNLHVLRSLASLDERRSDNPSEDDSPLMLELQRMDSKINVLLDIVDRLLLPGALLPPRQPVSLNAVGLIVPGNLLPADSRLLVRLHFDTCRALPLELPALRGKAFNDDNVFLYFHALSEMVEDGLERFVFCHHRRKVASTRLTGANETVLGSKHRV